VILDVSNGMEPVLASVSKTTLEIRYDNIPKGNALIFMFRFWMWIDFQRTGCRPQCVQNSDCPYDRSCVAYKCKDPCIGSCGVNSECRVQNHVPLCQCYVGYTGNAVSGCTKIPPPPVIPQDPCRGPICGPYSQCRNVNDVGVCSCLLGYVGSPPFCKPECISSSECPLDKACREEKCINPVSLYQNHRFHFLRKSFHDFTYTVSGCLLCSNGSLPRPPTFTDL